MLDNLLFEFINNKETNRGNEEIVVFGKKLVTSLCTMKFLKSLLTHTTPEWRTQYIDFELLRKMIVDARERAPKEEDVSDVEAIQAHYQRYENMFFNKCEAEMDKVNTFFQAKLAESKRKYMLLRNEMERVIVMHMERRQSIGSNESFSSRVSRYDFTGVLPKRTRRQLMAAYSELYLKLILLLNYQSLNYTGFKKILKKYDKQLLSRKGFDWCQAHVVNAPFYTNHEVQDLIGSVERSVTNNLENGNRHRAMERLRVPRMANISHPWSSFRTGLYTGAFIVLALLVVISFCMHRIRAEVSSCILLFHSPFAVTLFLGLLGMNVYVWRRVGINHVLIFELDPRDYLASVQFGELAAIFSCLLSLCVLAFLHADYLKVPPYVFPLALPVALVVYLINPLPMFHYHSRTWLIKCLGRVASAPFQHVIFSDFWLADQFNSLVATFVSMKHVICYYGRHIDWQRAKAHKSCDLDHLSNALVLCLPAWFRFAQCCRRYRDTKEVFPHLVNAGKYASTFFVVLFSFLRQSYNAEYAHTYSNPFTWIWFVAAIVSSSYGYAWDIKMDWGLFKSDCEENRFLRSHILYPAYFYYFAIVENFLLRYIWLASFFLKECNLLTSAVWTPLSEVLEVVRRFIWNFFRLENEHLNNCGEFRAVRDISIGIININETALAKDALRRISSSSSRGSRTASRPSKSA